MGRNLTSKNQAGCSTERYGVRSLDRSLSRAPAALLPCGFEGSAASHPSIRFCRKTHPYMCFLCTDFTVPQRMGGEPVLAGQVRKALQSCPIQEHCQHGGQRAWHGKVTLPCRHSAASHTDHGKPSEVLPPTLVVSEEGFGVAQKVQSR